MLIHFRLTVPSRLSDDVRKLLVDHECVTNVTVQPGAVVQPAGDLIEADVAREEAGALLNRLNDLGLDADGGIVISAPTATPFLLADQIEAHAPGHPDDAVIWESVEAQAESGAEPTLSFHIFLVIAVLLGAIAVVTDSAVLVVGAMVVGPEYSAVVALSAALVLRRAELVVRALRLTVFSFALAIVVVALLALVARAFGLVDSEIVTRPRPSTGFIWHPDAWSVVVALVAGVAGALALAVEKTSTMVGVFISVTTVPAAGNLALGLAVWSTSEIWGSLAQLSLNLACMVASGALLLLVVRTSWPWLAARSERIFGYREPAPTSAPSKR